MKFFFFDLDGTLEDSRKDMVAAAQAVRKQLNLTERGFDSLVPHVNRGMRELYVNCFDDHVMLPGGNLSEEKLAQVESLYVENYGRNIAVHTQLYTGIKEVLQKAKQMGRVAVITNKPEALSKKLLEALDVLGHVDLVVGGDTCSEAKPSPVPLRHALSALGGSPETDEVFMIGDSQGDAVAGSACGVATVWCAWGYQGQAPTNPAPLYSADKPSDLLEIFNRTRT
ncbi:MAG: hypothetical protein RI932_1850 [Pseudomonadota bacterium]